MADDAFLAALHTQRNLLMGTLETLEKEAHGSFLHPTPAKLDECRRELALIEDTIIAMESGA